MLTQNQIKNEITRCETEGKEPLQPKRIRRKFELRVKFLRDVLLYVETDPNVAFVNKQLEDVLHRIETIHDRCGDLFKDIKMKDAKKYMQDNGLGKLKLQEKHLRFVLKSRI